MRVTAFLAAIFFLSFSGASRVVVAQSPDAVPRVAFEVASVKVNKSGDTRGNMQWQPGGRFVYTNLPLTSMISIGFQMPLFRIEGLPDWVRSTRFDITALAGRDPAVAERPAFYRSLLEDRFRTVTRLDTRDMPVYALVLARSDGRLGPNLERSDVDCEPITAARLAGKEPLAPVPGEPLTCTAVGGPLRWTGGDMPLSSLTGMLSSVLQRPVLDRTGLTGLFDFELSSSGSELPRAAAAGQPERPSIPTALQEQLGLKLEPQRGPVEILVIEKIDMPGDD